jgi:hypothetical protein
LRSIEGAPRELESALRPIDDALHEVEKTLRELEPALRSIEPTLRPPSTTDGAPSRPLLKLESGRREDMVLKILTKNPARQKPPSRRSDKRKPPESSAAIPGARTIINMASAFRVGCDLHEARWPGG